MFVTITLLANQKKKIGYSGRVFVVADLGVATSLGVKLIVPGGGDRNDEEITEAGRGFKARMLNGRFENIELLSAVDATVKVIVSDNDIDFSVVDGATVNAVIQGLPLPVSNDRGTPGNLMHVTAVTVNDAPAVACSANAPVPVNDTVDLIAAADVNRRAIRFCNLGASAVALGPVGQTWAGRVIVLEPGDVWSEDRAANLAWYGITDAAGATSVTWQGITA